MTAYAHEPQAGGLRVLEMRARPAARHRIHKLRGAGGHTIAERGKSSAWCAGGQVRGQGRSFQLNLVGVDGSPPAPTSGELAGGHQWLEGGLRPGLTQHGRLTCQHGGFWPCGEIIHTSKAVPGHRAHTSSDRGTPRSAVNAGGQSGLGGPLAGALRQE